MSDTLLGGNAGAATGTPSWVADLPEDLRSNPTLQSFKGNDWKEVGPALAKSFIETKKMTGQKAYDLPKDDWKPEQWSEWGKLVGIPETPDKYTKPDKALLEKAGLSEEHLKQIEERAHKLKVTDKQYKDYMAMSIDDIVAQKTAMEQSRQESLKRDDETLRQEWGADYDKNAGLVKAALAKFGSPELSKWAEDNGAANNPLLAKLFAKIGAEMGESSARGGGSSSSGGGLDRNSAMNEITEMIQKRINDPAFAKAFENPKSAELARWNELHKIAYPQ